MSEREGAVDAGGEAGHGKRVGWVELYFDLVFVFAVSQVAHAVVVEPVWSRVPVALGVFATLWWTWIGFAVLYNRLGDDTRVADRLFVLAGTIPCAIAATQVHDAFEGHPAGFALALAGARLVLAVAHVVSSRGELEVRRIGWGYALSAALFAASAFAGRPGRLVLWAFALVQEAAFLLLGERGRRRSGERGAGRGDRRPRRSRAQVVRELFAPPASPHQAVDAEHLAERFGLFMIILLGELVVTVGGAALDRPADDAGHWLVLIGGLVLAGALWWAYFTSAAEINRVLLNASGGNPALAYSLYAGGHLLPAFSLLLIAAGVGVSFQEHPPGTAAWFITAGLAAYLGGTRVFSSGSRRWFATPARLAAVAITVCLALLQDPLGAPVTVAVTAAWAVACAAVVTTFRQGTLRRLTEDPISFLRGNA
jgi:low temperature requirement protein LtrA